MEKLNYMVYCWSQYIRSNRIVGVYLIALALAFVLFYAYAAHSNVKLFSRVRELIDTECSFKNISRLFLYCIPIAVLLIVPFTALALTEFQTVFYPYSALWTLAMVLPVTAITITLLITALIKNNKKNISITSVILILIFLLMCGSMGKSNDKLNSFSTVKHQVSYDESTPLLEKLEAYASSDKYSGSITVLAPPNITTYVHMYSGNIKTLYGKDMWDDSMKPYTYNEYPKEYCNLYTWINCIEVYGSFYDIDFATPKYSSDIDYAHMETMIENDEAIGGASYIQLAQELGINIIVVFKDPECFDAEAFNHLVSTLNLKQDYIPLDDTSGYILLFTE